MNPIERLRTSGSPSGRPGSTSRPSMMIRPELGVNMHPRMNSNVVLPEPEGPSSARVSPRSSASETPLRTGTTSRPSRYSLKIWWDSRTRMAIGGKPSAAEDGRGVERGDLAERDRGGGQAQRHGPHEDLGVDRRPQ